MKIKLIISILLIFLFLFSCDKKPVDSDPDPELKHAYLTVATKDSLGYIFPGVKIIAVTYPFPNDTIALTHWVWTDGKGEMSFHPSVREGRDTVAIFASMEGYKSYPDSFLVRIEYDKQTIYREFIMKPESQ